MTSALTLAVWFGSFVASAVLPWMNAELLMVALLPAASARGELAALAMIATAGQMAGKTLIYWGARGGTDVFARGRLIAQMDRWRPALAVPSRAVPLLFASSAIGFPPLFALTILAGSVQLPFRLFFLASAVGRIIHFGAIALVPALLA